MNCGWRGILSMVFLIAALGLFVAFNILPSYGGWKGGWRIWPELCEDLWDNPQFLLREPKQCIAIASVLCFSLLIVVSPFLKDVWPKSRLAWWTAVIFSGLTSGTIWVIHCTNDSEQTLSLGLWCLFLAPVLNFIGLLLARPQWLDRKQLVAGVGL
jgi:hypothetical protein